MQICWLRSDLRAGKLGTAAVKSSSLTLLSFELLSVEICRVLTQNIATSVQSFPPQCDPTSLHNSTRAGHRQFP